MTEELKRHPFITDLRAFHSDPNIKEKYLERIRHHRKADHLIRGIYWEEGKGCAIGCTLEMNLANANAQEGIHKEYEIQLGIPQILARLQDTLFEELPYNSAILWPEQFLSAINIGADLSNVWNKFALWLLVDTEEGIINYCGEDESCESIIEHVADLYSKDFVTYNEWNDAILTADNCSNIASQVAATVAATARNAIYAFENALSIGAYAGLAIEKAADVFAIRVIKPGESTDEYEFAAYEKQANKILELLRECE